jgi:3-oxoacyl-[acyl-carrier protein] reductase
MSVSPLAHVIGAGGIGTGVAEQLTAAGYQVVKLDRSTSVAPDIVIDLAGESVAIGKIEDRWRQRLPDLLLLALGTVSGLGLSDAYPDAIREIVDSNLVALLNALSVFYRVAASTRSADPSHRVIVVITSNAAFVARPDQPIYAATKAAAVSIVRSTASTFAAANTAIVGVAPGTVIVPRNESAVRRKYPRAPAADDRPSRRLLMPLDVGRLVIQIIPMAMELTGRTIVVDGGSTL